MTASEVTVLLLIFTFALAEDRDKFDYIFNKYNKLMLHKAHGILQDYHLAEDAASEAFIRIYKNLHKIDDPDDPKSAAFIITIVKNVSLTMLKQRTSHATEEFDEEQQADFNLEEQTLSQLGSEQIYRIVDSLNEELKSVFLLKYSNDLSHKEIGRILGISENNVTVRLHRARNKLAVLIKGGGYTSA